MLASEKAVRHFPTCLLIIEIGVVACIIRPHWKSISSSLAACDSHAFLEVVIMLQLKARDSTFNGLNCDDLLRHRASTTGICRIVCKMTYIAKFCEEVSVLDLVSVHEARSEHTTFSEGL